MLSEYSGGFLLCAESLKIKPNKKQQEANSASKSVLNQRSVCGLEAVESQECGVHCSKQQRIPVIVSLHLNHVFFSLRRHSELRSEINTTCPLQPLHQVPECRLSSTCVKREHNGPHVKAYLYRFLSLCCRSAMSECMHHGFI